MKKLRIYQENAEPLDLLDDDSTDMETYVANLSQLFSYQGITILSTTHSTVLVRPSKLTSIKVDEEQNTNHSQEKIKEPAETINDEEDIITDAD